MIDDGDPVSSPPHYLASPSGIQCIEVTRHMPFCLGNAVKYIWRYAAANTEKGGNPEDLRKAIWYLEDELRLKGREYG